MIQSEAVQRLLDRHYQLGKDTSWFLMLTVGGRAFLFFVGSLIVCVQRIAVCQLQPDRQLLSEADFKYAPITCARSVL